MNGEIKEKDLSHVIERMYEAYGKKIRCDSGWFQLIFDLDAELNKIDPDYKIYQIKEKFGELRFYFDSEDKEKYYKMTEIVERYEKTSTSVCEKTGKPGVLMRKNRLYKTLNEEFVKERWEIVNNLL
jgi:hypothetical protein